MGFPIWGSNQAWAIRLAFGACDAHSEGMANLTVRNLDPALKTALRVRAARHGRSMEEETRVILRDVLTEAAPFPPGTSLGDAIRAIVEPIGGIELELPPREFARDPPDFTDWPDRDA
jgi:antitoxin FitA